MFRYVTVILFIAYVYGSFNTTNIIIQRIRKEENPSTVLFFGSNKDLLEDILKQPLDIPLVIFTSAPKDSDPPINHNKNILFVITVKDTKIEESPSSEIEIVTRTLAVRKFVVVRCESRVQKLETYFKWLHQHKFTRIFGVIGNHTFAYFPYADTDRLKVVPAHGTLLNAMLDLNGFNIRTSIQLDAPRVFAYRNKEGQRIIAGYAAQVFLSFIRKHNARYSDVILNTSLELDAAMMIEATINGEIDMSMTPYVQIPSIQQSYPLRYMHWSILIPHNEHINPNQYFIRPFSWVVWLTIAALAVYIILLDILMDFVLRLEMNPWQSFSRTFCLFLFLSTEQRIKQAFRFHAQVLVVTFIIFNLYFVHLTSFLTVFIKARQAYTHQDLIDNQIRVLMIDVEFTVMELGNVPRGFGNIVTAVSINELNKQRFSCRNKSFAYSTPSDKAEYILRQQIRLDQPNFHISKDSIQDAHFGFTLPEYSPFLDILNAHVLRQREMGLIPKWESDAVHQGVEAGILNILEYKPKTPIAFTLRHLTFAWNSLAIGLVFAFVVFLIEVCVSKLRKSVRV